MSIEHKHRLLPCPGTVRGQGLFLGYDEKNKNRICYPSRAGVVVRSTVDPTDGDIYTGFRGTSNTTVAKFSKSGYYLAVGSKTGTVRVCADKRNEDGDFIEKAEYQILSGDVKDIAWDADNQRLVVVGNGKETFTKALLVNSGATVGDCGGHSNPVLTCDIKPNRPYRAITGSEDFKCNFFHGPPFKLNASHTDHTNYVTCARCARPSALARRLVPPPGHNGRCAGSHVADSTRPGRCSRRWDPTRSACFTTPRAVRPHLPPPSPHRHCACAPAAATGVQPAERQREPPWVHARCLRRWLCCNAGRERVSGCGRCFLRREGRRVRPGVAAQGGLQLQSL